jgi:hypothetical protein
MSVVIDLGQTGAQCVIAGTLRAWSIGHKVYPFTGSYVDEEGNTVEFGWGTPSNDIRSGESYVSTTSLEGLALSISFQGTIADWYDEDNNGILEPHNGRCKWGWELSGGGVSASGVVEDGTANYEDFGSVDEYGVKYEEYYECTSYSSSLTFDFIIDLLMQMQCSWDLWPGPAGGFCGDCPPLWCRFPQADACWLPGAYASYWYTQVGDILGTFICSGAGSNSWTGQILNTDGTVNPGRITLSYGYSGFGYTGTEFHPHPGEVLTIAHRRSGFASQNFPNLQYNLKAQVVPNGPLVDLGLLTLNGDLHTVEAFGLQSLLMSVVDESGEATVNYTGSARRVDGNEVEGVNLHTEDQALVWDGSHWNTTTPPGTDFTVEDGAHITYPGYCTLDAGISCTLEGPLFTGIVDFRAMPVYETANGLYRQHGPLKVTNCAAFDEPSFTSGIPEVPVIADSRVIGTFGVSMGAPDWQDVLTVFVKPSHKVFTFGMAGVTSTGCTVSAVTGGIKIVCTASDAQVTVPGTANLNFQGARYADINCAGDPLTLTIMGREFTVSSVGKEIDFLCPNNYTGSGTTQTLLDLILPDNRAVHWEGPFYCNPSWDWGIHSVDSFIVTGMEVGKTYYLYDVTLKRKSGFHLLVYPESSWTGNGNNNIPPDFGCKYAGSGGTDTHPADTWCQMRGYLIVDGVIGGVVIGNKYILTETSNPECALSWSIEAPNVNNETYSNVGPYNMFPGPTNGFIEVSGGGNDNCLLGYLRPGYYTGDSNPINVDADLWVDFVGVPIRWPSFSMAGLKTFSAQALVRLVDENKGNRPAAVRLTSRDRINELYETQSNRDWFFTPACSQLDDLYIKAEHYQPGEGDPPTLATSVMLRNRNLSLVTLKGPIASLISSGSSGLSSTFSTYRRLYRCVKYAASLVLSTSDDAGITWTHKTIASGENASWPTLAYEWRRSDPHLIMAYEYGGNIFICDSKDEGTTFTNGAIVMQGTRPHVLIDRETGMMLLYVFRSGQIYCKRSMDCGATWLEQEFVAIPLAASPAEDAVAAEVSVDGHHRIILCYRDSTDTIRTTISAANGLAPYSAI